LAIASRSVPNGTMRAAAQRLVQAVLVVLDRAGVVELRRADADLDVEHAVGVVAVADQRAALGVELPPRAARRSGSRGGTRDRGLRSVPSTAAFSATMMSRIGERADGASSLIGASVVVSMRLGMSASSTGGIDREVGRGLGDLLAAGTARPRRPRGGAQA
jgi:hypothetical protein